MYICVYVIKTDVHKYVNSSRKLRFDGIKFNSRYRYKSVVMLLKTAYLTTDGTLLCSRHCRQTRTLGLYTTDSLPA